MSMEIICSTDVRSNVILEETLKELNIVPTQLNEHTFTWGQGYNKMTANLQTGEIMYDEMKIDNLNNLKKTYSKNLVKATILKKGHHIKSQTVNANGQIEIVASY